MSSSEQWTIHAIEESTYNTTPGAGNFFTMRFNNDSLSGTPQLTESEEITGDGQPTGQIIVGKDVGGGINSQLSASPCHNNFIEGFMRNTWAATLSNTPVQIDVDATAKTLTRLTGSFITDGFAAGDLIQLSAGWSDASNVDQYVWITNVTATVITYAGNSGLADETGGGDEVVTRPARLAYGSTDKSFSICKEIQDLTERSISYTGMKVSGMNLNFAYGQKAMIDYTFVGAGHSYPATPMTDSRTLDAAGSQDPLNSSGDLGHITIDGAATTYCIEGLTLQMDNGAIAKNCVGSLDPTGQELTGLSVNATVDMYLEDANWSFHSSKLTQTPISLAYTAIDNAGTGFAVYVPALQLSFPDANAAGRRQINKLSLSGVAKKDATVGNTIHIYKLA